MASTDDLNEDPETVSHRASNGVDLELTILQISQTIQQAISGAANECRRTGMTPHPQDLTDLPKHVDALESGWNSRVKSTRKQESANMNGLNETILENEANSKHLRGQLGEREDDLVAVRAQRALVDEFNNILSHLRPVVTELETTAGGARTATDRLKKLGDSTHRIDQNANTWLGELESACTQFVDSGKTASTRMSTLDNDAASLKATVDSATIDMAALGQGVEALNVKCEGER